MKAFYLIALFFLMTFAQIANSQTSSFFGGGAHGESLAQTTTTFQGISSIYGNIAGLAYVKGVAGDISYDRRYNLSELSTASISAANGSKLGTFGFTASKYGFDQYSETKVGLAYSRKLSRGLAIGGMFDAIQYNIDGFGTTNRYTFELGVYSQLNQKLHMGVHLFSPGSVSLSEIQRLPSKLSFGFKYLISKKTTLSSEISKISEHTVQVMFAADYQMQENIGLRIGANISQYSFHAGTYFDISEMIRMTAAYSYHQILGSTPSLSFTYNGLTNDN